MSARSGISGAPPVAKLNELMTETDAMQEKIKRAMVACTGAAVDLEEVEEEGAQVQELEAGLRSFVDLQARLAIEKGTLDALRRRVTAQAAGEDEDWAAIYDRLNHEEWTKWTDDLPDQEKYGRSDAYREFRERVWEVNHNEPLPPIFNDASDDELIVNTQVVSLICPLTRQVFYEPVKSAACGHCYSKAAILDLIRQSGTSSVPCPIPGCHANVAMGSLQPDRVLERKVARHLAVVRASGSQDDDEYENLDEEV
ncbi:hypothetical protein IWQ60_006911 [Tieghemiomyces parasiticus]|uniref:SP-RING-type domain-containing protein n=1 Tax=Tieghemiomyces parasiticus TaxID=78921 RepID=A0A9W8AAK8_9FUNG|nr:hypothetical protein IWQ60_006911 [Tieghemiomyces parasiticus]